MTSRLDVLGTFSACDMTILMLRVRPGAVFAHTASGCILPAYAGNSALKLERSFLIVINFSALQYSSLAEPSGPDRSLTGDRGCFFASVIYNHVVPVSLCLQIRHFALARSAWSSSGKRACMGITFGRGFTMRST